MASRSSRGLGLFAIGLSALGLAQASPEAARGVRVSGTRQGPEGPRVRLALDHGWRFRQTDGLSGVENPAFDDSGWTAIEVPHTWNRLGNEGTQRSPESNVVRGVGWYRLRFPAPRAGGAAKRYFLEFDGVSEIADVWLNGRYVGKHAGAFSRFRFDVTAAMDRGGENLLVVKADNSLPRPGSTTAAVIPLSGDFFVFGGIYRKVSLVVTDPVHVDMLDYGSPGVYVRTASIRPEAATVEISGRLVNDGAQPARVQVEATVADAKGTVVARASKVAILPAAAGVGSGSSGAARGPSGSRAEASGATGSPSGAGADAKDAERIGLGGNATSAHPDISLDLRVPQPRLWRGTQDPYLYRAVLTIRCLPERREGRRARGEGCTSQEAILDQVSQPLGLRTIAFDPDKGFFLNGAHLFLQGVSMHQDRPGKGWAISAADQEQDFKILRDLGGSAVRLAHYQHDQRSYELADELGIVAWAEIPLVNQVSFDGTPASPALADNARQQLRELIRQNYNHPSIALWSIANEVDLLATVTNGPSRPRALLESLNRLAKAEDPGRFTTLADCCEPGLTHNTSPGEGTRDPIVGITDTIGYNRYFGWYGGTFSELGPMLDAAHARHPGLPLAVSEYGAGAALSQHSDDPSGGPFDPHGRPHPEEYQCVYHEASWNTLKERPYLWGVFIWNLFDFAVDSRKEGDLTDMNDKGLVTYDRTVAKDAFYFYRANWSRQPTLHLVGRRHVTRASAVLDVKAYSNATRAELWLNGAEQGTVPCSGGICLWRAVHLQAGSNELRATANIGGEQVSDALQWKLEP
jgi:beta-galactosidase